MSESEKPHSSLRHVYAVVRFDFPVNPDNPENTISVVKVFSSKMSAEREVARLNGINSEKRCRYVLQVSRLVPGLN